MKHVNHIVFSRKKHWHRGEKHFNVSILNWMNALAVETPFSVYCPHATFCLFIFERLIHESFQYVRFADFSHTCIKMSKQTLKYRQTFYFYWHGTENIDWLQNTWFITTLSRQQQTSNFLILQYAVTLITPYTTYTIRTAYFM